MYMYMYIRTCICTVPYLHVFLSHHVVVQHGVTCTGCYTHLQMYNVQRYVHVYVQCTCIDKQNQKIFKTCSVHVHVHISCTNYLAEKRVAFLILTPINVHPHSPLMFHSHNMLEKILLGEKIYQISQLQTYMYMYMYTCKVHVYTYTCTCIHCIQPQQYHIQQFAY